MRYRSALSTEELEKITASLIGVRCWAVSAGGCVGSRFILHCGNKIPRDKPLTNPSSTDDLRHYSGSILIAVGSAAWTLCDSYTVVTTWRDESDVAGGIAAGLQNLIGQPISFAHIDLPGSDLEVRFGQDYRLKVLCDGLPPERDNYSIIIDGLDISAYLERVSEHE